MIKTTARIFLAMAFLYCCKTIATENQTTKNIQDNHLTKVTVTDYRELDGCSYILRLNDTANLIPLNLADSLKKNNLELMVAYKEKNVPNICMAGKTVELTEIKFVK